MKLTAKVPGRGFPMRRVLAVVLILALLASFMIVVPMPDVDDVRRTVTTTGAWAPVVWLALMVGCTQFPLPRTVWTISAGALFGSVGGSALAVGGLAISALVSLLLIRRLGVSAVRRTTDQDAHPRLAAIQELLAERGWVGLLGLRMIPAVPFSLLNYVCAVTTIPVVPYLAATVLGSAPNTIATVIATDALLGGGSPWALGVSVIVVLTGMVLTGREARILVARGQGVSVDADRVS